MVVQRVHLAERARSLPAFISSPPGSAVNVTYPSSISTPSGAEREEEIGARVRIDDRLERRFRLVHLQRRTRVDVVFPGRAEKVADDGDVRIEDFRSADRAP